MFQKLLKTYVKTRNNKAINLINKRLQIIILFLDMNI